MTSAVPLVAFGSLGGTITMTQSQGGGVTPTLTADDLAESVPGLSDRITLVTETLATRPGPSMPIGNMWDAVSWAREQVDAGAVGVVLAQGTDTIEETSFLADLYWDRPEPLVITGAMRAPVQLSPDGPANVMAACTVAASHVLRDCGVVVVLDNTINAARFVRKSNSWSLHTFQAFDYGPMGYVVEGEVRAFPRERNPVRLGAPQGDPFVPILETHLGDDASALRAVVDAGAKAVVIGAFGVGHVSFDVADAVAEFAPEVPIVVATRAGTGGTLSRTYGYKGAEMFLQANGAILSGELDSRKARTLTWAALAAGASARELSELFARFR